MVLSTLKYFIYTPPPRQWKVPSPTFTLLNEKLRIREIKSCPSHTAKKT